MDNRLEELRKERGIKQEDLARELGVSRQTISSLEKGRYNPSILLAFKIARRFGMQIEDVFILSLIHILPLRLRSPPNDISPEPRMSIAFQF